MTIGSRSSTEVEGDLKHARKTKSRKSQEASGPRRFDVDEMDAVKAELAAAGCMSRLPLGLQYSFKNGDVNSSRRCRKFSGIILKQRRKLKGSDVARRYGARAH